MIQVFTLLTMALELLIAANQPNVPQSLKNTAASMANYAIETANKTIKEYEKPVIPPVVPHISESPIHVSIPVITPPVTNPIPIYTPEPKYTPKPIFTEVPSSLTFSSNLSDNGLLFVEMGKPVTFSWSSSNATSCFGNVNPLDSDSKKFEWYGTKHPYGTQTIIPRSEGIFIFTFHCVNDNGTRDLLPGKRMRVIAPENMKLYHQSE